MKDFVKRNGVFIGVLLVTFILLVGGVFLFSKDNGIKQKQVDTSRLITQNSFKTSGYVNGNYLPASASATITLVEFGDYECPACSVYSPMIKQLLTEFSGKITYIFRNYPLPQHKNAPLSSYTAEAAGLQGKYWQMHEKLFATQGEWSKLPNPRETFIGYAKELNLDIAKFISDLDSAYVKDLVKNDVNDGNAISLTETPTFYLNNLKITVSGSYEEFRNLVKLVIPN